MLQPSLFSANVLSVSDLTRYLHALFESDDILRDVWVAGEVSNLSRPASGHIYFTLKDSGAALRCVMWRTTVLKAPLARNLRDGAAVEVHGAISVYERDGTYQLYADRIKQAGEGDLYQQFLRLKERLEAEGLFAEERKRPLPEFPLSIGIVTSPTGAALQDMLNTLSKRFPLAQITLAPAAVQGDEAPRQIVAALRALNRLARPDVIIVARGGGSLEDLWAFNDERVVRAVADSEAPVISGVGHETDFTLTDFAADRRAPTPTGAAVLATPDAADLRAGLRDTTRLLTQAGEDCLEARAAMLEQLAARLDRASPLWQVRSNRQRLDEMSERARGAMLNDLALRRVEWNGTAAHLAALDPQRVLQRGFAVVTGAKGQIVRAAEQVAPGENLDIRLAEGGLQADVTKIIPAKPR